MSQLHEEQVKRTAAYMTQPITTVTCQAVVAVGIAWAVYDLCDLRAPLEVGERNLTFAAPTLSLAVNRKSLDKFLNRFLTEPRQKISQDALVYLFPPLYYQ